MIFNYDVSDLIAQLNNIDISNVQSVTASGSDLNTYTDGGIWYFGSSYTPTNKPADVSDFGFLVVIKGNSVQRLAQIWIDNSSSANKFYVRVNSQNPASWSSWEKLANGTDLSAAIDAKFPSSVSNCNLDTIGVVVAAVTGSASNRPDSTSSRYGTLWHYASSANYATQIYQETGTADDMWVRKKSGGTWGDWHKVVVSNPTLNNATIVSTMPSGITSISDVKYVKSGNVVTVYFSLERDSTSMGTFTSIATGLPTPAFQPQTSGSTNIPLAQIFAASSTVGRPLGAYVHTNGSLRVNYGTVAGTYTGSFSYITSDV